jgi:uncharacterized protein (TIGR03435 family)
MSMRVLLNVSAAALVLCAAPGLTAQPQSDKPLAFDVTSVRPHERGERAININTMPGGRFVATNVPVRSLVRLAYGLEDFEIVGGPAWMNDDRFDIQAKASRELPPLGGPFSGSPEVRAMLRALLAERFQLAARVETREMPMFALVRARQDGTLGEELTPSTIDCPGLIAKRGPDDGPAPCGLRMSPGMVVLEGAPIGDLAPALAAFVGRRVIDKTGLTGSYDLQLHWAGPQLAQPGAPSLPSLFTALREQAGLTLEAMRGPAQVLVIDRIERPTPN